LIIARPCTLHPSQVHRQLWMTQPEPIKLYCMSQLRLIDSITQLTPQDAGCIAVSGSHGGISSAQYAAAARPALSVFNDAGVGKAQAGIAGLAYLQACDLAACAVAHTSARIGVAQSTLDDGIISSVNTQAYSLGLRVGHTCIQGVAKLQSRA
jgi:hypothetical protein